MGVGNEAGEGGLWEWGMRGRGGLWEWGMRGRGGLWEWGMRQGREGEGGSCEMKSGRENAAATSD